MKKALFWLILCCLLAAMPAMAEVAAGDTLIWGMYEQDNDLTNGAEPIEWQVLEVSGDQALLISVRSLDSRQLHEEWKFVTWGDCSLRVWLNDTFLHSAFTEAEREAIQETLVVTDKEEVTDRIFILSIVEARKYLNSAAARKAAGTDWAVEQQIFVKKTGGNAGFSPWWLRDVGQALYTMAYVKEDGNILFKGIDVDYYSCGVRPVMWAALDKLP